MAVTSAQALSSQSLTSRPSPVSTAKIFSVSKGGVQTRTIRPNQGSLFTENFLSEAITGLPDWKLLDGFHLEILRGNLKELFDRFPTVKSPNESQTEDDLIWPVLAELGWTDFLRQQNLSVKGRRYVPDGLLFADASSKETANQLEEWQRYGHGLAIVESKRWRRPLDRRSARLGEESAPSSQMVNFLRRVDDVSEGNLRWGILSNGARWRLYWAGARSASEQFFELDLEAVLAMPGALRHHWLKVFWLVFRRDGFLVDAVDGTTFHQRAIEGGQFYQERVANNLSKVAFEDVFPDLVRGLAGAEPETPLSEVRHAALVLLYRLLFVLYAEDRGLLPAREKRYDDYAFRNQVRSDVRRRKDEGDTFSTSQARFWYAFDELCRAIDNGDPSIGLPPYDGGLFDREMTPMLSRVRIDDALMANVVDALSFEQTDQGRRYINYRDLGVQQLGSIYERLLEREVALDNKDIIVGLNVFARKDSGSYYTPDTLVDLIVRETVGPLADAHMNKFVANAEGAANEPQCGVDHAGQLRRFDPASAILTLKVCDPAMGSGHFLVNLVDYLADRVIESMAEAEALVEDYLSPLSEQIDEIRQTIERNADQHGWDFDRAQLDDRHIIRRLVLKRCIYGVDKNPMAVELAKVSLWLHTFTVGAPLSFLDHHLRCGDSLFGAWVSTAAEREEINSSLLISESFHQAVEAATRMQLIERLTDVEIDDAHRSAEIFDEVLRMTAPLDGFLSLLHAFDWLNVKKKDVAEVYKAWLLGAYGDPIEIAHNGLQVAEKPNPPILHAAVALAKRERFFNWQIGFPGVWSEWESTQLVGGFDAVIGNPPWDRMKLQQVEWFAARRPEIAMASRAADRKRMIAALTEAEDPLAEDFRLASEQAEAAKRVARSSGNYPLLATGDINLYQLFVERAMTLVKPNGMVGLLVPSGIASDKTKSAFFKSVATEGRLQALYDFENRKVFFPDVHSAFRFCVFVASRSPLAEAAKCAFYLHAVSEIVDPDRCISLTSADFARVNPNTGAAPSFRSRRDAELTTTVYKRLPLLEDRSSDKTNKTWPVQYERMLDLTNHSHLFRTRSELEQREGAWPIGGRRFDSPSGEWVPLYEGKMVQAYDHRAASIVINPNNVHRPAQTSAATQEQHKDPTWSPDPRFWVPRDSTSSSDAPYLLGFKDVTAATNSRTMIAAMIPPYGAANSFPLLNADDSGYLPAASASLLLANLNAIPFDFMVRQKLHGQTLNLYIVEQLPVVPVEQHERVSFGPKTAAEIIREAVLELTYTAHDMAAFARDLGYVDDDGNALPPYVWDDERRLQLRAKLDAVYFCLYGITDRDDIRYIYSTFPHH